MREYVYYKFALPAEKLGYFLLLLRRIVGNDAISVDRVPRRDRMEVGCWLTQEEFDTINKSIHMTSEEEEMERIIEAFVADLADLEIPDGGEDELDGSVR